MADPEGTGSPATPVEIPAESWRSRLVRLRSSGPWATHGLLLLAVSISSAFLVSPGLYSQHIPELSATDLGKPFRSPSPSGFKAGRDYEVGNEAMTEERRTEARASVRPVFDYDPSLQSGINRALQGAFEGMQELLPPPVESAAPAVVDEPSKAKKEDPAGKAKKKLELEREDEALSLRLREARKAFDAALPGIEEEDFEALVRARFSREAERAALSLIETAYRAKIVSSRDELSRVDAQGITVRILGGSSEHLSGSAPPAVHDMREAQADIDRVASVPGNMLPDAPSALRRAVLRVAKRQLRPNLTINIAETDSRRRSASEAVKKAVISIKKGQKVIGDGELINPTHLVVLKDMREHTEQLDLAQLELGGTGLVALIIAAAFAFHRASFRRFRPTRRDALLLGALLLSMLGLMHLWMTIADAVHDRYTLLPVDALYYCVPIAAGAMLVRFVLTEELALFFAIVLSCLAGVKLGNSLSFAVYSLVGSLVAAERITHAKDRVGIFKAGLWVGAANFCTVLFFSMAEGKGTWGEPLWCALFALVGSAAAVPIVVMALTPLVEAAFGYASDIKLLELANLNHPALKELIVQAPGTYHHSIIIGSLVEAAAESIGANPLLARSCAYYHDIGKGRNPLYFGENQKGENRHDTLAPTMSAVIIKRHVTEGLEMARQYKLPRRVADVIPQHHGTRFVGYFLHKAQREQEGKEHPQPIDESIFRYPGPKPQSRETALVMIADAVEAASRAMPDQSTAKLQLLVQKLINLIFSEGQLDECDLTLKDLNLIALSFVRTLEGIYHARPSYPPAAMGGGGRPVLEPVKAPLAMARPLTDSKRSIGGQ